MKPKIHIPTPCSEDWSRMEIGLRSRFCQSCTKNVMDFTEMTRQEILEYLIENRQNKVCGHIFPSQLDFTTSDYINSINSISASNKNTNLGFYLLALGTMVLAGYNSKSYAQAIPKDSISIIEMVKDTSDNKSKACSKQSLPGEKSKAEGLIGFMEVEEEIELLGDIEATMGEVIESPSSTFMTAEIMPEFPGGMDSLHQFIETNINTEDIDQQGRVFVQFVVTKEGTLDHLKFYRPELSTATMREEAARIIHLMPSWIPGKNHGKPVDVSFMLPITFK